MPRLLLVLAVIGLWIYVRVRVKRQGSSRQSAERPKDFIVNEATLANRFAELGKGPRGTAFRAFLAHRCAGDELWCVHSYAASPDGSTAYLVIVRPVAPGERAESIGDARGRLVSRFRVSPD